MKLFRRLSALTMVLALLLSLSISVFAVDFTNMDEGFAYEGEDTDVNINISEDVEDAWYEAKEGKNYNIGTDNGSTLTGVGFGGSGDVVINADVTGLNAFEEVNVTVNGNVAGIDNEYSSAGGEDMPSLVQGGTGVYARDEATVTVNGNVTGGNGNGTVGSQGGSGVGIIGPVNVTITGDATGGNAADSEMSIAVPGALIQCMPSTEAGSLTVGGTVQAGEGTEEFGDLYFVKPPVFDENGEEIDIEVAIPEITVGVCEDIVTEGFTEEEAKKIEESIKVTGLSKPKVSTDSVWSNVLLQIKNAKPGDEITVNVYSRMSIPAAVIEAVREYDVKLIIQWAGGDDLVITKDFTAEVSGTILLKDLAEMLKK